MKSKKWAELIEYEISQKTLNVMDKSVKNMKEGKVSEPINLSKIKPNINKYAKRKEKIEIKIKGV